MEILKKTKQICLPNEIINTILEYQGYHIWRNGKFICRLNINDKKYNNLKNLNIIQKVNNSYNVTIKIMQNHHLYKYIITQRIYSNMIHWYMDKYWYYSTDHNTTYNNILIDEKHYVFCKHISQNLPMLRMD